MFRERMNERTDEKIPPVVSARRPSRSHSQIPKMSAISGRGWAQGATIIRGSLGARTRVSFERLCPYYYPRVCQVNWDHCETLREAVISSRWRTVQQVRRTEPRNFRARLGRSADTARQFDEVGSAKWRVNFSDATPGMTHRASSHVSMGPVGYRDSADRPFEMSVIQKQSRSRCVSRAARNPKNPATDSCVSGAPSPLVLSEGIIRPSAAHSFARPNKTTRSARRNRRNEKEM